MTGEERKPTTGIGKIARNQKIDLAAIVCAVSFPHRAAGGEALDHLECSELRASDGKPNTAGKRAIARFSATFSAATELLPSIRETIGSKRNGEGGLIEALALKLL